MILVAIVEIMELVAEEFAVVILAVVICQSRLEEQDQGLHHNLNILKFTIDGKSSNNLKE